MDVMLRPDLRTAGGEVNDILWNGQFVGSMTLVYRESDRLCGAIQLEQAMLPPHAKAEVISCLQQHVQALIDAMGIISCDVLVTYSEYDRVIATDRLESSADNVEEDLDYDSWNDYDRLEDENPADLDEYTLEAEDGAASWDGSVQEELISEDEADAYYELTVVSESRNKVKYHIYDEEQELVAECDAHISGREVSGSVRWMLEPEEDEIEAVADLLVSDFDEDEVDSFVLHMEWDHDIIETIELTHEDLLDAADEPDWEFAEMDQDDYSIVLARDDGDMLTYEIYQQSHGGLPIGTATIDISQRQVTGFIDFREPGDADDREYIVALLMQELDKEKDFETFNVTMLFQNQPFEEMLFENEQVH
ncbi:hypothetical protein N0M98_08195 [Paenibacillus doosanensis]|uniref:hypothetical protein n=1 Tax=Paenibacillus doosanensis TaxID=1229154 RepID=UPI00217F2C55|nr:hypothetical protein [Paenibacillus doosanensis]MCS7460119.1 hypothetical protein [Paenibacillus doosanensis]